MIELNADFTEPARLFREAGISRTISIFGSARTPASSQMYQNAVQLAREIGVFLAQNDLRDVAILTGGGPGIMEAANLGARESGASSLGFGITLPCEQRLNAHLTHAYSFSDINARKRWLCAHAAVFVAFPGGFGTLDELFCALTLTRTGLIKRVPIVLFGANFWRELIDFSLLADERLISQDALSGVYFCDEMGAALNVVKKALGA